jgi:glycosyltransferase involved in cell wall biosynthesis
MRAPISAFVVSYNRAAIIETCLKSVRFADELIVVDKGSTDGTAQIAARYADRLITVPWSPTVEITRQFALSECSHDVIVFLDDDEVLSVPGIEYILERARTRLFDVLAIPLRHYILGRHDEGAYYWPERQIRAFRKPCVEFGGTVHAGVRVVSGEVESIGLDTGICVHNVSYRNTHDWVEKTNRYTSCADRAMTPHLPPDQGLRAYLKARTDHWFGPEQDRSLYVDAISALRVVYDIVDIVKSLESTLGVSPDSDFAAVCNELSRELEAFTNAFRAPASAPTPSEQTASEG